jgi:hypothetical protein
MHGFVYRQCWLVFAQRPRLPSGNFIHKPTSRTIKLMLPVSSKSVSAM